MHTLIMSAYQRSTSSIKQSQDMAQQRRRQLHAVHLLRSHLARTSSWARGRCNGKWEEGMGVGAVMREGPVHGEGEVQ